ncbi:MAG: hypothetical protein C4541_11445 [Candidatus Auribacter fodinae]|uniref:Uncharacterized protein n=1 Tax=Candidatus Auribacter fodinae TaxID=2093366 RepID=A0A3A4R5R5_9BACT|nr:MAG: hypothetical protein C4541_11445 [Candidatus Auribacter fodinae]
MFAFLPVSAPAKQQADNQYHGIKTSHIIPRVFVLGVLKKSLRFSFKMSYSYDILLGLFIAPIMYYSISGR